MDINSLKKDLKKVLSGFESNLIKIQIGKASIGVIENLQVYIPSWKQTQRVQSLGTVSLLDSQTIKIECWDRSVLPYIEKAIYDSQLGFTPVNEGDWIMVKIPPMTEERRQNLLKVVKKALEEAKIRVRQIRHDFLKDIKSMFENKEITEDEKKQYEKQLDDIIKDYNKKLENLAKSKEQEILKI